MGTTKPQSEQQPKDPTPSLVARFRDGDAQARACVFRFCWGYLSSVEEAEDAVQELSRQVLSAKRVPDGDASRPWLYRVARNHCLNVLRRRARRKDKHALPSGSWLDGDQTGVSTKLMNREQQSRLFHLLAALPGTYREVLQLRYTEGLSRAEIAEVLRIPQSVVKSRLFDGLKKLRQHSSLLDEP